jgi:hypothetical protein
MNFIIEICLTVQFAKVEKGKSGPKAKMIDQSPQAMLIIAMIRRLFLVPAW